MKHLLLIALIICFIPVPISAQLKYVQGVAELQQHPRILLFEGEEKQIEENIRKSTIWKTIHDDIIQSCESIIAAPASVRKMTGKRLLGVSRDALRRIFFLSYAYRMTGKEKYFLRAEEELLAVSRFSDWNPRHFLDVAEMTIAVSIGYDWLYHRLPETSKDIIRDAIIHKGLSPSFNHICNGFLRAKHNWNQVCNAGVTYGAIAVYEDIPDLSKTLIDRSLQSIELAMSEYAPDGAYPEGSMYWNYGTGFNVMLLSAIEKLFSTDYGLSQAPGFLETPVFFLNTIAPTGLRFNYSDCGGPKNFLSETMVWFAKKINDYSILWEEFRYFKRDRNKEYLKERLLPAIMIWGTGIEPEKIHPPQQTFWTGKGVTPVAFMRSSWETPGAIYVGLKAGTASSNHAHMDVGSFVMEADGIRWGMDLGSQNYNSLESKGYDIWNREQNSFRWKVFRYNNFAHNTLTVNNKLHNVKGHADIQQYSDDPLFMNAVTNITELFGDELQSATRGIALINRKYVLIQDEISTQPDKGARVRWTMVTDAVPEIKGKNTMELRKDGKTLKIQVKASHNIEMKTWSANPGNNYDAPNEGVILIGFEVDIPANTQETLTVYLLPRGAKPQQKKETKLAQWPQTFNK